MFVDMDTVLRAILFGGLFLFSLAIVLGIVYDAQNHEDSSRWSILWWIAGGTGVVLVLPALVINAFNLDVSRQNLIDPLSYLGIIGTILAVVAVAGYFITRSSTMQPDPWPTQPFDPTPLRTEPLPVEEAPEMKTMQLRRPVAKLAALWITNGARRGANFSLSDVTNIGRSGQRNDVVIADEAVSGDHARIRYDEEKKAFVFHDLASMNGSWLIKPEGKERVEAPHVLKDGDVLELGSTLLTYKEVTEEPKA